MSVVLQEVWLSLSPPPRVFSGISLRPREALRGNYLGRISCTYSHTEMIFGTIFKYSKTNYMQNKWQHFIENTKVMWCWLFLACHLRVDKRGPSTTFQNSVIVSTWKPITWFLWHSVSLVVCKHVVYLTPPLVTYACHLLEVHCWYQIKRGAAPVILFLGQTKIYHKQRYASPGNVIGEFHVISEKQT